MLLGNPTYMCCRIIAIGQMDHVESPCPQDEAAGQQCA